jgi:hypothetical protein
MIQNTAQIVLNYRHLDIGFPLSFSSIFPYSCCHNTTAGSFLICRDYNFSISRSSTRITRRYIRIHNENKSFVGENTSRNKTPRLQLLSAF